MDSLRTFDLPAFTWLRNAHPEELPHGLSHVSDNVRKSMDSCVCGDSFLSDVFLSSDGAAVVNPDSRVLSGHFGGMPIVPGVASKRLMAAFLRSDLYQPSNSTNGNKTHWKTEFSAPMTPGTRVEFRLADGSYELTDGKKAFAKFTYGEEDSREPHAVHDFWAVNVKDMYHGLANSGPKDDADKFVLQSEPFRFVTTAGEFENQPNSDRAIFLWWYFEIPENFPFVDEHNRVHNEIAEESVAQIASFAYSKSRNLPSVRTEGGEFNPKALVLTFKSSVAEAGVGNLFPGDKLSVAIHIFEEDGRTVKFAYEAWNSMHSRVLKGIIEGSAVPLKLLKRMAG